MWSFPLVLARIIHPGSTLDSSEPPCRGRNNLCQLPHYYAVAVEFKQQLTHGCTTHAGLEPGMLVLYAVTTLYFETDRADKSHKPGFSKERRLEP